MEQEPRWALDTKVDGQSKNGNRANCAEHGDLISHRSRTSNQFKSIKSIRMKMVSKTSKKKTELRENENGCVQIDFNLNHIENVPRNRFALEDALEKKEFVDLFSYVTENRVGRQRSAARK